jgi:hypothetical protein
MGNAGLICDQRYRTDPDTGMPMPDRKLTAGKNANFIQHYSKNKPAAAVYGCAETVSLNF